MCVHAKVLSRVRLFATLWTVAHQAPLSMGFPKQEYWSGLPFPSPGDLPNLKIKLTSLESPALAGESLPLNRLGCPFLDIVVAVQLLSYVRLLATTWTAACQASLSFTISWSLLKLMSIESVRPSNHLIFCHPLLLLPSILLLLDIRPFFWEQLFVCFY